MDHDAAIVADQVALDENEIGSVARKLAEAFQDMASFYMRNMKLEPAEIVSRAGDPGELSQARERALQTPPDQVSWIFLEQLFNKDPEIGQEIWRHLKREAEAELASGHLAAGAFEYSNRPFDRARYLAVRNAFIDEWQPAGGIELALIDTLAQTFCAFQHWLERAHVQNVLSWDDEDINRAKDSSWRPPRVSSTEAMEQAAAMADRFNRMFLRTLRALRDLRRYSPSIVVQQAGQVNVADKQINIHG